MFDFDESEKKNASQNLQVWCCNGCSAVHFKAGNVLLNFSKTEFAELTNVVMDIYQQEFGSLEFYRLINSINQNDEVLLSQTIA